MRKTKGAVNLVLLRTPVLLVCYVYLSTQLKLSVEKLEFYRLTLQAVQVYKINTHRGKRSSAAALTNFYSRDCSLQLKSIPDRNQLQGEDTETRAAAQPN